MLICVGLLRGIDPLKKLFYVTTPLPGRLLELVNVFVLGNPDKIEFGTVSGKLKL